MNTKEIFFSSIITALVIPITLLNIFAGIVGGIWILVRGEWELILFALLASIVSTFFASLALMPSLIGVPIITWATQHKNKIALILGVLLSSILTAAAIYFISSYLYALIADNSNELPKLAVALLAYSVAIGPWQYMAAKENRSDNANGTTLGFFFVSLGLALTTFVYAFSNTTFSEALSWFFLTMLIYVVVATITASQLKFNHDVNSTDEQGELQ